MEYPFYDFFVRAKDQLSHLKVDNSEANTKAFVCLEGSARWHFPTVVRLFRHFLGEGWNLYLYHTEYNSDFMQANFGEWDIGRFKIDKPRVNLQVYNGLFKNPHFWKNFKEDKILVFQGDCIACKPFEDKWLKWDMIGGACGPGGRIYQGGMSLRTKHVMVDALMKYDWLLNEETEDIFFTKALTLMGAKLPNMYDAGCFSCENEYFQLPFGFHGIDKGYMPLTVQQKIVEQIKL